MLKKFTWLPIVIALGLMACKKTPSFNKNLVNSWELINQNSGFFDTSVSDENWKFLNNFTFQMIGDTNTITGKWAIKPNKTVVLELYPNDTSLSIDSSTLKIEDNHLLTHFYHNSSVIAHLKNNQLYPEYKYLDLKIIHLTPNELTFELDKKQLSFKSKKNTFGIGVLNFKPIGRGLIGLFVLLTLCFILSTNRKAIRWKLVFSGVFIQIIFAVLVFEVPLVRSIFETLAGFFVAILEFTRSGSSFLFGSLLNTENVGYIFAFQVLPTIVFFSALTSLFYHLGVLQKIVTALAWIMSKTMKLSGAESLSTAANIFLGQTEAPLMVKPYIAGMTKSEILCIMIGGMATIAGGVLAAYVGFLGGPDPEQQKIFATHLLTASILAAPATVVASKMLLPETEAVNENLKLSNLKNESNALEAITTGTTEGVKLAINVGAMLLVFTALIAMLNYLLKDGIGHWTGINEIISESSKGKSSGLTLQWILGYVFSPLAFIVGIPMEDITAAGQLLGEKTVLNEFYAYSSLAKLKESGAFVHNQSIVILTYALCGFANFASIGIQIGGISTMAPNQRSTLAQLGIKALIGGTIACLMTATIAGMFF